MSGRERGPLLTRLLPVKREDYERLKTVNAGLGGPRVGGRTLLTRLLAVDGSRN